MEEKLVKRVNEYLANIGVMYIKLHNLHWNVTGGQFVQVHEYLETLYDEFAELMDRTAEILKMHEQMPLGSMKEYLAEATIEELKDEPIDIPSTLKIVLGDMKTLKAQAEALREKADKTDTYAIVNMAEDDLAHYDKTIWFLKAMQS